MHLQLRERRAEHVVAFYRAKDFVLERLASFVSEGLAGGEHVIVLATSDRWGAVSRRLEARGMSYGRAISEGRLVVIAAEEMVDTLTVDGRVSVDAFRAMLVPLLRPGVRTRVYGELVSLVAHRGDLEAAIGIERLGHELAHKHDVPVLCGYHLEGAPPLTAADIARIEQVHDRSLFDEKSAPPDGTAPRLASEHGRAQLACTRTS